MQHAISHPPQEAAEQAQPAAQDAATNSTEETYVCLGCNQHTQRAMFDRRALVDFEATLKQFQDALTAGTADKAAAVCRHMHGYY